MARRKSGGSSAGMGVVLVLGVIVWAFSAASKFIVENQTVILVLLALGAALALIGWIVSRAGRQPPEVPAPDVRVAFGGLTQSAPSRANARWVPAGQSVSIGGFTIKAGQFYLGDAVANAAGPAIDQYVVNPRLAVHAREADVAGATMSYWPSYASIRPEARRAFLEWMSTGRSDPAYGIGHVFLFFYGLEHRQFVEGGTAAARSTIPEVERLLSVYGGNGSFRGYADTFLAHARISAGLPRQRPAPSPNRNGSPEIPPSLRIFLGEALSKSNMLSADDMLLWTLALPDTYLRTPAIRCFDQFVSLWRVRFSEKYPSGFAVKVPAKKLSFDYRAASGAFSVKIAGPHEGYPDVTATKQSFDALQRLVQACTEELEAFSRFVGKRPDRATSPEAAVLLPQVLHRNAGSGPLNDATARINGMLGARSTTDSTLRAVMEAVGLEVPGSDKLPQSTAEQLTRSLDLIDIAIEPDRRYGGGAGQLDDPVVIFRAANGGPIDPGKPLYTKMKMQVEVSALAASADGSPTSDELQTIIALIKSATELDKIEGVRLIAYAVTLFKSPPKLQRIMRRVSACGESERRAIAAAAAAVIGRAGNVDPKHVRFLEKLNKALGLSKEQVYADLHRVAVDEPVVIASEDRAAGVRIPSPPDPAKQAMAAKSGVLIDEVRLAAVRKQTQAVSAILTQIFVDETAEAEAPADHTRPQSDGSPLAGLDAGHAELVEYLEMKGDITRREFEDRARSLKLLPDGAIEKINDWAFDTFEEPLLEDGENVVLFAEMRGRLAELRASGS